MKRILIFLLCTYSFLQANDTHHAAIDFRTSTNIKQKNQKVITLTKANHDQLIKKSPFIIITAYVPECDFSRHMLTIIEYLAQEHDEITFAKLDIDRQPKLAQSYGINGYPIFILIKDGKLYGTLFGTRTKQELEQEITAFISS